MTIWELRTGMAKKAHESGRTVGEHCCELCGRSIRGEGKWIEVSVAGSLILPGTPVQYESQGEFLVGPDCYKKALRLFAPQRLAAEDRTK